MLKLRALSSHDFNVGNTLHYEPLPNTNKWQETVEGSQSGRRGCLMERKRKNTWTAVWLWSGHLETPQWQNCVTRHIAMFVSVSPEQFLFLNRMGNNSQSSYFPLTQTQSHRDSQSWFHKKSTAEHSDKPDPLSSNQKLCASHEPVGQVALGTDPDSIMGWINTIKDFILLLLAKKRPPQWWT